MIKFMHRITFYIKSQLLYSATCIGYQIGNYRMNPGNTSISKGLAIHLMFFPRTECIRFGKWKYVLPANSSEKKLR